jgi:hypothetical protein
MKAATLLPCGCSLLIACALVSARPAPDQSREANYDEAKVGTNALPDPLALKKNKRVADARTWVKTQRPAILRLFETEVYGRSPGRPREMKFENLATDRNALGGKATRKQIRVWFTGNQDGPGMDLLLYLPNNTTKPVPAFLGLNFNGNHSISADPGIRLPECWVREGAGGGMVKKRAPESSRGSEATRWPVEMILARGYALATVYYGDVEPDFPEGWKHGVRAALSKAGAKTQFKPDAWGGIGAWAWGLARALDYLETDPDVDAKRVAVMGHSRLGKTALWAGAEDERFAIVISNDSGEGGAALARRNFGETTAIINRAFPHWFCGNFKQYSGHESALPVDQHELIALLAPRPAYVASAEEDKWADPRGEFLAAKYAGPVYELFGRTGLGVAEMPAVNHPVGDFIGYHIRTGKHDVTDYDWQQYLNFADRHFKGGPGRPVPPS